MTGTLLTGAWMALTGVAAVAAAGQAPAPVDLTAELPAEWRGTCDLVVVTSDEQGQPVPSVAVGLRLGESAGMLRGLETDAAGRLALSGLAAGEWQVELQREGFMLYTAYLKLDPGRQPEVGFTSRQRTGSFWTPLEAVFLGGGDRITPAVRTGRQTAEQADREARRLARREEQAQRRQQRQVEKGRAATLVTAPDPDPDPDPAPAPSDRAAGEIASEGEEIPPAESDRARRLEPDRASADRAASTRPAADPPAPASRDAGAARGAESSPRSAPPAASRLLPNPDLLPAGACPECRPGEWSVSTQAAAAPSGSCAEDGSDGQQIERAMERVAEALAEHLVGSLAGYAGALWAEDGNDALRLLPDEVEEELRSRLAPIAGGATSCPVVAVVLPGDARYVGFRYAAGQRATMAECPPGQACLIGEASWRGNPTIREAGDVELVWARFDNAHAERVREPRLTVYFEPSRGWLPPR